MGININKNTSTRKPEPYGGLSWFDTPEAKSQHVKAFNNYKAHYDDFLNSFREETKITFIRII